MEPRPGLRASGVSDGVLEVLAIVSGLVGAAIVLGFFLGFWK
jgi:hypothetical protein